MTAPACRRITIPSRLDRLGALRGEVHRFARDHGFAPLAAEDLGLCVHEAASNAMVHGNRDDESLGVEVTLTVEADGIRVAVTNGGPGFDAATLPPYTDERSDPRGRGMRIIHALAHDVSWSDAGRTIAFLVARG